MKKRTASVLKWIGLSVVAVGVLYTVLLLLANLSLRRAYAALEADGRPMNMEQIIPAPIPDPDNAALVYQSVVLQLKAEPEGNEDLFAAMGGVAGEILREDQPAEMLARFHEFSRREVVVNALAALARGAAKPACRYEIDYTQGAGIPMPHLSELRTLSRILCATARDQAAHGDPDAAWRTVVVGLQLANALKDDPILISQLVRIAQFTMVADTIQVLCASTRPSAEQQAKMEALLASFDDTAPLVRSMDGERLLLGEWAFRLPCWMPPLRRLDHAVYLRILHEATRNAGQPYSAEDAVVGEGVLAGVPWYCVMTRMFVPAMPEAKRIYFSMVARGHVVRAGLAVLRYRQDHGTYPADLAAANAQGLADPFSGKPLQYHGDASGFVLYSVGKNLKDDGGLRDKDKLDDIAWTYREQEAAEPKNAPNG